MAALRPRLPEEHKTSIDPLIPTLFYDFEDEGLETFFNTCVEMSRLELLQSLFNQPKKQDLEHFHNTMRFVSVFIPAIRTAVQNGKWEYVDLFLKWTLRPFLTKKDKISEGAIRQYFFLQLFELPFEQFVEFQKRYVSDLSDDRGLVSLEQKDSLIVNFLYKKIDVKKLSFLLDNQDTLSITTMNWYLIFDSSVMRPEVLEYCYSNPTLRRNFEATKQGLLDLYLQSIRNQDRFEASVHNTSEYIKFLFSKNAQPSNPHLRTLVRLGLTNEYKKHLEHLRSTLSPEELKKTLKSEDPLRTACVAGLWDSKAIEMLEFINRYQPELFEDSIFFVFFEHILADYNISSVSKSESENERILNLLRPMFLRLSPKSFDWIDFLWRFGSQLFHPNARDVIFSLFIRASIKEEYSTVCLLHSTTITSSFLTLLVDRYACDLKKLLKNIINLTWNQLEPKFVNNLLVILKLLKEEPFKSKFTPDSLTEILLIWNRLRISDAKLRKEVAEILISMGADQVKVARMMLPISDEAKNPQSVHNRSVHRSVSASAVVLYQHYFQGTAEDNKTNENNKLQIFTNNLGQILFEIEKNGLKISIRKLIFQQN